MSAPALCDGVRAEMTALAGSASRLGEGPVEDEVRGDARDLIAELAAGCIL